VAGANHSPAAGAQRIQFEDTLWKRSGNLVYFEGSPNAFKSPAFGLLGTCHQLRAETLDCVSKTKVPYVLDLLIIDDESIWATWLSIPPMKSSIIETLEIKVRFQQTRYFFDYEPFLGRDWFSEQLMRIIHRVMTLGSSPPCPSAEHRLRKGFWGHHELSDVNPVYEYIPHHIIRRLIVDFAGAVRVGIETDLQTLRPKMDPSAFTGACKKRLRKEAVISAFTEYFKGPNGNCFQERVGGYQIFLAGECVEDCHDLEVSMKRTATIHSHFSKMIPSIQEVRRRNGL